MTRLRHSDPSAAGWTRRRSGTGFSFRDLDGQTIRGEDRERCLALAIPPAWTEVWICPWPNGHIQAVGTDAAGRRQYLYHQAWRERRDRLKFDRMLEFGAALPAARRTVADHLALSGMPRERALAVGFRLMDDAGLRVGGEAYARDNGSSGVATLRREHASTSGDDVRIQFAGKSGREHDLTICDPELAAAVHTLLARRAGGPELLAFRADDDTWRDLTSADINDYVREVMGAEVTAKDFRTWRGVVGALEHLSAGGADPSKAAVAEAMREVADRLGNTPAVARSAYVDPRIVERYLTGEDLPAPGPRRRRTTATGLSEWEEALLGLLRDMAE